LWGGVQLARALQLQTLAEEELAVVQKTLSLADEVKFQF
jgi:hypothetical protein